MKVQAKNLLNIKFYNTKETSNNIRGEKHTYFNKSIGACEGVNFRGSKLALELISDLKKIEKVSCPCCGQKMLSSGELNEILKKVPTIKTTRDFLYFLKENESYVVSRLMPLITNIIQDCEKNVNEPLEKILNTFKQRQKENTDQKIDILQNKYKSIAQERSITDENKNILTNYSNKIKYLHLNSYRLNFYRHLSKYIRDSLNCLSQKECQDIYRFYKHDVKTALQEESLFLSKNENTSGMLLNFFSNLFSLAKSDIHKVFDDGPLSVENIVLQCDECGNMGDKINKKKLKPSNYYNYVYKMAHEGISGNIPSKKDYAVYLFKNIKTKSFHKLVPNNTQTDLYNLIKSSNYEDPYSTNFKVISLNDVCCASCGQKTLTHIRRLDINKEIQDCKNNKELINVVHKYKDYIKPKFNDIIKDLTQIIDDNPNISNYRLQIALKVKTYKKICKELNKIDSLINKLAENEKLNLTQKYALAEVAENLVTCRKINKPNSIYKIDFYKKCIERFIKSFETDVEKQNELRELLYTPIKKKVAIQKFLYSEEKIVFHSGSIINAILDRIISHSVATIDHLNPRNNYKTEKYQLYQNAQSNKQHNLVVMCKECNLQKDSMDLKTWINKKPEVLTNIRKYLAQVQEFIRLGKLDSHFLLYPRGVIAQIKKLTGLEL